VSNMLLSDRTEPYWEDTAVGGEERRAAINNTIEATLEAVEETKH